MMFAITDYAMKSEKRHGQCHFMIQITRDDRPYPPYCLEHEPGMWNDLRNNFVEQLDQVNADLKANGLPPVVKGQ